MAIKRRTRIWTTVSTAALIGSLAGCSQPADQTDTPEDAQSDAAMHSEAAPAGFTEGEGEGEGEGGAGGGEFGIDPQAAESDPVVYLIALEVMRAHYLAGIDAFEEGERTAGAEMFAHPISEIYIDFEPALEANGANLFGDVMTDASVAPYSGESDEAIAARVADVLSAIDAASEHAPGNSMSRPQVHAQVLGDLIERAALQYRVAAAGTVGGDAYLDGYGFTRAAAGYAQAHLEEIGSAMPAAAAAAMAAIDALDAAYPTASEPEDLDTDPEALLALVSGYHSVAK